VIRNLFDPSKKWVSPTPQKNGKYYGLFDKMSPDEKVGATPSEKGKNGGLNVQATPSRKNGTSNIQATPSRKIGNVNWDELPFASTHKHSRTPTSSAKRHMLNKYISVTTPSKPRDGNGPDAARTPSSSVSKIHFPTPSYLKRDGGRVIGGGEEFLSPPTVRGPRKPLGRGLSSILADLRQMHDDAQDEELEDLREVENEMEGGTSTTSKPKPKSNPKKIAPTASKIDPKPRAEVEEEIQVEDSQTNHLLSGFDDESKFDSDPETLNRDGNEKLGRDGQPLRIYKKKGQKRTTRRTKIRPTRPGKAIPHDVGRRLASESPEPEGSPLRDMMANDYDHDNDEVLDTQNRGIMTYDDEQTDEERDDELPNEIPPDIEESSGIIPFDSTLKQKLNANDYDELGAEEEDEDSGSDYTASSGGTRYRKLDQSEHLARVAMRKQAIKEGKSVGAKVRKGVRKVGAVVGMNFRKLKLRGKGAKAGGGGGKGRFGRRR